MHGELSLDAGLNTPKSSLRRNPAAEEEDRNSGRVFQRPLVAPKRLVDSYFSSLKESSSPPRLIAKLKQRFKVHRMDCCLISPIYLR